MTGHDKIRRAMDEVANLTIRLQTTSRLASISQCRITNEMFKQASRLQKWSYQLYSTGSMQECFPPNANGDADTMICKTYYPLVLWKSQENERGSFVMAEQDPDRPVYLRLKAVDKDCLHEDFKTIVNEDGYLKTSDFIKVTYSNNPMLNAKNYKSQMRHGPSIETKLGSSHMMDVVQCLKCQSWPPFISNFFTRKRLNNWPYQKLLDKVKGLECHVVAVGYPGSESYDTEWRLSLSVAERELLTEMYEPYAKCMYALKSIKKKYIFYSDSDKPTPFCSYFIKTACLWMCERFPHTDYSVMDLIRKVLDWLIDCYQHKHLPYYFIPQHNLIGHLSMEHCDNVKETLTAIKKNLWRKVLLSVDSDTTFDGRSSLNFMCDELNVTRDDGDEYSTLETTLLNHSQATVTIEGMCFVLRSMIPSQNQLEMARLAVYNDLSLIELFVKHMLEDPLKNFSIPAKIILPIIENIKEIVPKGYGEMFKTSLYRYLGNTCTHLLVCLRNSKPCMYDIALAVFQNTPLQYYTVVGAKMNFPDNYSDDGIGGKVLVVKYHYIMRNYKELKQMCDSILLDCFLRKKNCRLASVEITMLKSSTSLYSAWDVDEMLLYCAKSSSKEMQFCHPIILILYIKARVLLIEGDTENALNAVKKMKESMDNIIDPFYHHVSTNMFIAIIESLVGLLGVMRRIAYNGENIQYA
ncbi:uncharacterized protein LOC117117479 [Anneissia japonica]|uniref:uncharacterized protein LOC117117479 n=1 Tax=Anneissia japonica TaxID=1529436 RepID=UPI0014258D3A|nr:uncharacterized protein LOC117117479 [Anneissia japonica]